MLEITPIFNSSCEDVLAFKTCCGLKAADQNLEIQIRNLGTEPVILHGWFDLESGPQKTRIENLLPGGDLKIAPGEVKAFYCFMDEDRWKGAENLVFEDAQGRAYRISIKI